MEDPSINHTSEQYKANLLDYLIVLAKHSRIIVYLSMVVTVLVYVYLFVAPNVYTATACLLPPQQNLTMSGQLLEIMGGERTSPGSTNGAMGGIAATLLGKSPSDYYVALLLSNTLADHMVERFDFRKLLKKSKEDARKYLWTISKISSVKKTGFIEIKVTDKDPKWAAEIANAFGEELDKLLQGIAVREAKDRLAFLEKERIQAADNLNKAEESLRTFSDKNSVIQIDAQIKGMLDYIATLRASIDTKEIQIQVMRQGATPFNYDIIRLETELNGLKEKLRASEIQWDKNCLGDVCLPTSKVPTLGLEYIRLYRDVKYQEKLYQLFTKMVEIGRMDKVKNVAVVQALDPASPPERRSNQRLIPAIFAGIITFFLMIFVAFALEYWQQAKTRKEVSHRLEVLKVYLDPWSQAVRSCLSWYKRK